MVCFPIISSIFHPLSRYHADLVIDFGHVFLYCFQVFIFLVELKNLHICLLQHT